MKYTGNPVSAGIAVGPVFQYRPVAPKAGRQSLKPGEAAEAVERFRRVREAARAELEALAGRMAQSEPGQAKIFVAHQDILMDVAMEEDILGAIEDDLHAPDWALEAVFDRYAAKLAAAPDALIRERAADLRDVKNRFLRCWQGLPEQTLTALPGPVVLVAQDLLPSDTAALDTRHVLAIVTQAGGSTSHSAIIARSYGIPALMGVAGCTELPAGHVVVVDAIAGELLPQPDEALQAEYRARRDAFLQDAEETKRYRDREAHTADGVRIEVELNIGAASEKELAAAAYTDGVGLFRTEFLYLGRSTPPGEEEQVAAYRRVLERYRGRPVILRTMDIGGDKELACLQLPREDNPFLGRRALRLSLAMPELFETQLRACLRAGVYGDLWLMFPMVGGMEELRQAKAALARAGESLRREGLPHAENPKVGIMVEIPSVALLADKAARETDFASIGTNDLTQYTLAADRMNPDVAEYYRFYHPALFRLMAQVVQAYKAQGKPVSVCGEMGGDPAAAAALVGLGIRRLSMGASAVAGIKRMLAGITLPQAEGLARQAQQMDTEEEVRRLLQGAVHKAAKGG